MCPLFCFRLGFVVPNHTGDADLLSRALHMTFALVDSVGKLSRGVFRKSLFIAAATYVLRGGCGFHGVSGGFTPYRSRGSGLPPFEPLNLRWSDPGRMSRSPVQDSLGIDSARIFRRSNASARRATFEFQRGKLSPVFPLIVLRMAS